MEGRRGEDIDFRKALTCRLMADGRDSEQLGSNPAVHRYLKINSPQKLTSFA